MESWRLTSAARRTIGTPSKNARARFRRSPRAVATMTMAAMATARSTSPVAVRSPSVGPRIASGSVPQRGGVGVRSRGVTVASLHVGG